MSYDRYIPAQIEQEMHHARMGNGSPEIRQTQISAQCAELAEQQEVLMKLVHELEDRLNAILRPANDERGLNVPDELRKSESPLAPHADFLQTRTNVLKKISNHLGNIIQRIEL